MALPKRSILSSVAAGVKELQRTKRELARKVCIQRIMVLFRDADIFLLTHNPHKNFQFGLEIDFMLDSADPGKDWSESEVRTMTLLAVNQAFGSPMLTYEQRALRQHCTQYHNPMAIAINVEPMGIPDEDGNVIKYVVPGGLINVPTSYTLGGKRSVVHCSAPQLKPCPLTDAKDNLLDLTPVSFAEWIQYYPYQKTECCNMPIYWSDKQQALLCPTCLGVQLWPNR